MFSQCLTNNLKTMTTKFASLITLGAIASMIFTIFATVAFLLDYVNVQFLIAFTIAINVIMWLVSPIINDWMFKIFYKIKFYKQEEFQNLYPELADFIHKTCLNNNIKFPKIGIINDDNPTAFTYGSLPSNARIVFSKGIFTYLDPNEVEAIAAHEIGHIVHYDFIVMTVASTMVQILYEIYFIFYKKNNSGNRKDNNIFAVIGIISYVFYVIAGYILLFLSRSREYYADEFSANTTRRPNDLSSALIKIAYGMVAKKSDGSTNRLMESTRSLGAMDPHLSKGVGVVSEISGNNSHQIGRVMAFDFVSPWAVILELSSTHPLTGKRIRKMDVLAQKMGQEKLYDIKKVINDMVIDRSRLYSGFYKGVVIYYLPHIAVFLGLLLNYFLYNPVYIFVFLGLGMIGKALYRFPNSPAENVSLLDLMMDIYASPIRGKKVAVEGRVIGRGEAGAYFSEDLMFEDNTGIIYLDYSSKIGFVGNLFFALSKIKRILGKSVSAEGWFFRGNSQMISLKNLRTDSLEVKSYPKLWSLLSGIALAVGGFFLFGVSEEVSGIFIFLVGLVVLIVLAAYSLRKWLSLKALKGKSFTEIAEGLEIDQNVKEEIENNENVVLYFLSDKLLFKSGFGEKISKKRSDKNKQKINSLFEELKSKYNLTVIVLDPANNVGLSQELKLPIDSKINPNVVFLKNGTIKRIATGYQKSRSFLKKFNPGR